MFGSKLIIGSFWASMVVIFLGSCKIGNITGSRESAGSAESIALSGKFVSRENLTPQYMQMSEKITTVADKYALSDLIRELKQNYDSYPPDLQFVAAFYIPMAKLQSIVYRLEGLFEKSQAGAARDKTTHSFYISLIKASATGINTFLPNQNWNTGFRYVTEPFKGADATNAPFLRVKDFQSYLMNSVLPELENMYKSISKIQFAYGAEKPAQMPPEGFIVFDNKILYGTIVSNGKSVEPFPNNLDRYILVGEAERKAVLASIKLSIHNLLVTCALNLDTILDLNESLAKALGFDNDLLGFREIEGLTSERRAKIVKDYAGKYKLFAVENPQLLQGAFANLKDAVNLAYEAWKMVKARKVEEVEATSDIAQNFLGLNPARLIPWSRMTNAGFENLLNIVNNDKASVRSEVTGEVAEISLKNLYFNPPANLADFMPTRFETQREITEANMNYRNYFHGTPLEWNLATYINYFPSVQKTGGGGGGADVRSTARIISQAWGGWFVSAPMILAL
ncbi:MAG: hypothetical protein HQK54_07540 [Oligoflexales bacterium]|nr:hypothetical protein [Oligoflexales bacterium]